MLDLVVYFSFIDIRRVFMYVLAMNYFLFAVMLLLFAGCDSVFGTRDAEDPNEDVSRSLWQQPTTPEIVLVNMSNAFLERNSENYMRSLTDPAKSGRNFVYIPDQETAISNPGSFTEWGLSEERLYINFIFSKSSLPSGALSRLVFTSFEEPSIPSDTAIFEEIYDLQIEHELINIPKKMGGIARLRLSEDSNGNWSIYRWEDLTFSSESDTVDLPTWSVIKARAQ